MKLSTTFVSHVLVTLSITKAGLALATRGQLTSDQPVPLSVGRCHALQVPVNVTAQNYDFSTLPGINDPAALLQSTTLLSFLEAGGFSKVPVSGSEVFAGTYCEPTKKVASRQNTLQLLVHGITYTRDYWQGNDEHFQIGTYSWVEYALKQGYPTYAIDRIGNGLSSHPDPIATLQMPYEVRATHSLIQMIRKGKISALPRAFSKIIYIGHSYGSVLGNNLANEYPQDADASILTGFSHELLRSFPGIAQVQAVPANTYSPQRFGTLPPGYLVTSSKYNRMVSFFWKSGKYYNPEQYTIDYATQGTVGTAEVLTVFTDITQAPNYKGKVFVLTGNEDEPFCGLGNPDLGPVSCGTGPCSVLAKTQGLFPAASAYDYYAIPNTGHCLNFHYSAPKSYKTVHDWMAKEKF